MKAHLLVLPLLLCAGTASAAEEVTVHRYAVLAGASHGGGGRAVLRYALEDARAMARVLDELGGVPAANQVRLEEPSRDELVGAIVDLAPRLSSHRGARVELFVYYSGHSDEEGLLLDEERLPYRELRAALQASPADVRIAILDSCASGAMTRRKGGKKRPPFLVDASSQVRGYAVLTSSSETESAQESDRIGASFFTHYLVTGLRGAADIGGDGRVTLNEAYHFAFHETLERTERTQAGAQHPAYDIQLVGMGDLVMTDLRATSAGLLLGEEVSGRVYLRDADGALVAELDKPAGRRVELGLAAGAYKVTLEKDGEVRGGQLQLIEGRKVELTSSALAAVDVEPTVSRGDPEYVHVPVNLSIIPALSFGGDKKKKQNLVFQFLWSKYALLQGVEIGTGVSVVDDGVYGWQSGLVGNISGGRMYGVQTSAGFNIAAGQTVGAQLAAGLNIGRGVDGAQLTAGLNIDRGTLRGVQGATGFNFAHRMIGTQLTAGMNWAEGALGMQVASVNYGRHLAGAQVGLLNIGGTVSGAQIGLINIATERAKGMQLGLLNYATEMDGAPLGLLSIVARNGTLKPSLWSTDIALANVGLKLGAKHLYGIFSVGGASAHNREGLAFGLGLGGHIPISERWSVDIDAINYRVEEAAEVTGDASSIVQVRLTPAYQLFDDIAIVAGPALAIHIAEDSDDDASLRPGYAKVIGSGRIALWPSFSVGLQFF